VTMLEEPAEWITATLDALPQCKEQIVYRAWDIDLECLYVGSTTNLRNRFSRHADSVQSQGWLPHVAFIDFGAFPDHAAKMKAERFWWYRLAPPFNKLCPFRTAAEKRERDIAWVVRWEKENPEEHAARMRRWRKRHPGADARVSRRSRLRRSARWPSAGQEGLF
jgi:hypothetical protein